MVSPAEKGGTDTSATPATEEEAVEAAPPIQVGRALDVEGESFLVGDFESEGLAHGLGGSWTTSFDSHSLGTTLAPTPLTRTAGGANSSDFALRIHGHFGKNIAPWPYADVRASFERTDLNRFSTVRFWAKGDGKKYVLAIVRTAVADYSHYRAAFVAPEEWTLVELPLASFVQPEWGVQRALDFRDAEALSFQPDASLDDESYDLWIDKLELVR